MIKQLKEYFDSVLRLCKDGRFKYSSAEYRQGVVDSLGCIVQCCIKSSDMSGKEVFKLQQTLAEIKLQVFMQTMSSPEAKNVLDADKVADFIYQQVNRRAGAGSNVRVEMRQALTYCFENPTLFKATNKKPELTEDEVDAVLKNWGCGHRGGDGCYCTDDNIGTCTYVARQQLKSKKE